MDALKAKLPGASALAKQKMQRLGVTISGLVTAEGYYALLSDQMTQNSYSEATNADTSEDKLELVLDVINYATIWAAHLMLAIEEQQRAAWDPTHPDHVGPTYGGR